MPGDESDNASTAIPVALNRAVELMRAEVSVRAEWRETLLSDVLSEPQPSRFQVPESDTDFPARTPFLVRRLSVRPLAAIAACLMAMAVGAVSTLAVMNQSAGNEPALLGKGTDTSGSAMLNAVANEAVNSGKKIIRFALVAPGAGNVSVVGDFNNWNPTATPLRVARDGSTWLVDMPLSAGRHVYAFVVDGDLVADPSAPRVVDHDFGSQNSVVLVGSL